MWHIATPSDATQPPQTLEWSGWTLRRDLRCEEYPCLAPFFAASAGDKHHTRLEGSGDTHNASLHSEKVVVPNASKCTTWHCAAQIVALTSEVSCYLLSVFIWTLGLAFYQGVRPAEASAFGGTDQFPFRELAWLAFRLP